MYKLTSPNGKLKCNLNHRNEQHLTYSLHLDQTLILEDSPLGLSLKGKNPLLFEKITLIEELQCDKEETLLWGQSGILRDYHSYYCLECSVNDGTEKLLLYLEFKVYNEGLAFRYRFSEYDCQKGLTIEEDLTGFNLGEDLLCSYTRGEQAPEEAKPFSQCDFIVAPVPSNLPVIAQSAKTGLFLALFESAPVKFSQMFIKKDSVNDYTLRSSIEPSSLTVETERVNMPWRIIQVSPEPGDFLTSAMALNLAEPCRLEDTSWIKPGKSTWDWRVHGASYGGFTYGINTASMKRLVDFSSENGYPYFLLDGGWYSKEDPLTPCDDVDIEELVAYARKKDVSPLFYYDLNYTNRGVDEIDFDFIARTYKQMGAGGIK